MASVGNDIDRSDIEAVLAGDEDAYGRIVRRYENDIARQMWQFSRERDVLDELVSDVFVSAYTGLAGYRGDAPFAHWLRRIATRVGYARWKQEARERDRRETLVERKHELPTITEDASPSEAAEYLHVLFEKLSTDDRLVLTLQYFEDCDTEEIARRTGWNRNVTKVRAFRARRRLKKMLEEAGFGRNEHERSAAEA